jgi:fructosamine-3-kinase
MIPPIVKDWFDENHLGNVIAKHPVGGGCINNGMILTTDTEESFFLKVNPSAPTDMFLQEVTGLNALRVADGPVVPQPLLHGIDFLLMEDLNPAPQQGDYWIVFGHQLAALHNHTNDQFGFSEDNYIGSTPQPNSWTNDGYEFFAQQRLLFQANMAYQRGLLNQTDRKSVELVVVRIQELIPSQPASLLHGDLWPGNATTDTNGNPAIIDPAAHYGWAEAELAMTTLFGSFPSIFYRAYEEVRPLEPGYQNRFPIYNLYHLLNHLNIFGHGYLGQVQSVLRKFG